METLSELVQKDWKDFEKVWYVDGVMMGYEDLTRKIIENWGKSKDVQSQRNYLWYMYGDCCDGLYDDKKDNAILLFLQHNCILSAEIPRAKWLVEKAENRHEAYLAGKAEQSNRKNKRGKAVL